MSFAESHRRIRETEVTMIICSDTPQAVLEQIGELQYIGNYRLSPQGIKTIRDCYLDTPDGALAARRLALRIRDMGGQEWLTVKGAATIRAHHAIERLEIESPWPSAAARDMLVELRLSGIKLPGIAAVENEMTALASMTTLGFVRVEEHTTQRDLRNVFLRDTAGRHLVAELAIDSVVYRLENAEYRHRELEIESKDGENTNTLGSLSHAFVTQYSPALRIWYHSKLATALALRTLIEKDAAFKRPGDLSPLAYDRIDAYLSAQCVT